MFLETVPRRTIGRSSRSERAIKPALIWQTFAWFALGSLPRGWRSFVRVAERNALQDGGIDVNYQRVMQTHVTTRVRYAHGGWIRTAYLLPGEKGSLA